MKRIPLGLITLSVVLSIFAVTVVPGLSRQVAEGAPVPSADNTLGPNPPLGRIDSATCSSVSGFALDPDNLTLRISVHIYLDGKLAGGAYADRVYPGLINVGWLFNIDPLLVNDKVGHTIDVYGIDINGNGDYPIWTQTSLVPPVHTIGQQVANNPLIGTTNIGPCTKTCANGSVIAIAGVCTKTCANGSVIAETSTCTITCANGSVIAETSTCPRAPTLSISTFDCTAIVFTSQDPDSPATKLVFLVGRSMPVGLLQPGIVDAGTGGTWTIPAIEKNASPHSYYILVAGVDSSGALDAVDTTSAQITIPICAPPPPPPRAPTLSISTFDCTAIVFTSQDPDSPATKLTFLVGRSTPVGLFQPGLVDAGFVNPGGTWTIPASEKNASPHSYFILVAGVNSSGALDAVDTTPTQITIPICAPAPPLPPPPVVVNCADGPHPAPYTCPVPVFVPPPPVLAISFKDLFKDTCKNAEGIATVCKDRDVLQSASCNSIFGTCGIIGKGISLISILIGLAAVVMIMIGGFKYVASAGDPNQAATARRTVLFAAIGVAISILAQGFIRLVINRL